MPLNLFAPETTELKPRILVCGVGGAGGNAVNNMIDAQLEGVDFLVANTDAQALQRAGTDRRIQMGAVMTKGLGAGARPDVGAQAAEDSLTEITEHFQGAHMVFITAGMGGGTGTGGAPVIARAAREQGILTVGVVTKPFHFEGARRMKLAEAGIKRLQEHVDTLIIVPNQNLFRIATEKTTFAEAFSMADQVLHSGVRGITDLMVMPGLINLDFADVCTVMNEMGKAMMGTGEASGEKRAVEAAQNAINNPLLDDVSMKGAKGVLINITGGMDMTLYEVDEAANEIRKEVDPEANIIVGSAFDPELNGLIRVSVVATGVDAEVAEVQNSLHRLAVKQAGGEHEAHPQCQVEPLVRRTADAAGVDETSSMPIASTVPSSAPTVSAPAEVTALDAFTGGQTVHPTAKPVIAKGREHLAREMSAPNTGASIASDPQAETAAPKPAPARAPRRGLSLFSRRKPPQSVVPGAVEHSTTAPSVDAVSHSEPQKPTNGPLFSEDLDEKNLEIPAFLRRQAN